MKLLSLSLFALLTAWSLQAQTEVVEIPTEVSEAPYEIGDLVTEQGYYIDRGEDEPRINLRIVGNLLRVYWIDANGLIAEPEYQSCTVRFVGTVNGRAYHRLNLLSEGSGLGAPGIIPPPHIFGVILVFPPLAGEDAVSYSFRYLPGMDVEVDPTVGTDS